MHCPGGRGSRAALHLQSATPAPAYPPDMMLSLPHEWVADPSLFRVRPAPILCNLSQHKVPLQGLSLRWWRQIWSLKCRSSMGRLPACGASSGGSSCTLLRWDCSTFLLTVMNTDDADIMLVHAHLQ